MVTFICQFDWATGCPDTCSTTVLGVSAKVFLGENNIFISRIKQIFFCNVVGLVQSGEGLNRTEGLDFLRKRKFSSRLPSDFICNIGSPESRTFRFRCSSLCHHMRQFFVINLFVYNCICSIGSVSLETPHSYKRDGGGLMFYHTEQDLGGWVWTGAPTLVLVIINTP